RPCSFFSIRARNSSGGLIHMKESSLLLASEFPMRGSHGRVMLKMLLRTQAHRDFLAVQHGPGIFFYRSRTNDVCKRLFSIPLPCSLPSLERRSCCSQPLLATRPRSRLSRSVSVDPQRKGSECGMIVILGLVILVAAVIVGVGGVLGNGGSGHALSHGFALFGYHVTGSTGTLVLYGIVVGAVALFGLSLLLAGARRTSLRGRAARRGLKQSRHETAAVSQDRDDMIDQRDTARAEAASVRRDDAADGDTHADSEVSPVVGSAADPADAPVVGSAADPADGRGSKWQLFGNRSAHRQAADTGSAGPADQPAAAAAADASAAAE